ncbi:MAG TPA: START domain-containing protein [Mucilaginibacter sp.]|nr:START domain-containing protein [Mucilaginibacter sp.]
MKKFLWLLIPFILRVLPAAAQGEWELKMENDGIKVYTGTMPDSKIKAIKVECTYNATPAQLVATIMDVSTAPDWVYHVKSAVLLKQVSPAELYYYSEVNLPWPAANRDYVAHLIVSQDPNTRVVTIDGPAVPGWVPVKKGVVRIDHSIGKWTIIPTGPNQVRVVYTIHLDPGGSLPAWLVNMFATDAPVQIFKSLRTQLQKPEYRNTYIAFLQ